ncbi:MAG: family 20 glycosylhydrolase [Clostridia bacterium]|nr:family 20 glycosylhydrolase [Clostridia bacterium]
MKFKHLSALIECSTGSTPTPETVKRFLTMLSGMGYTELYLGLTDAYKIKEEPYFNYKRGGYTTEELKDMDAHAHSCGIELIANIQTLGHLDFLERHESYRDMMDTKNILLADDERVYTLIKHMFSAISEGLSSRRIHIGFDECWGLGTGNYLKKHGPADKKEILLRHLKQVLKIAESFGYTCEIWHDMLVETDNTHVTSRDVRAALPDDVTVWYWDYWEKDEIALQKKLDDMKHYADKVAYAGTAFKCGSMTSLNTFSLARLIPQMKIAAEKGLDSFMVTLWSDNGAWVNNYSVLPALYAAAEYARGTWNGVGTPDKERFSHLTGGDYDALLSLDNLDDIFDNRPADWHGNRSFWIFLTDIANGGWDLMLNPKTPEAYQKLSEHYRSIADSGAGGAYSHLFRCAEKFAIVLSLKSTLGVRLRRAYKEHDTVALADCAGQLSALQQALDDYIPVYEDTWLCDNMPYGLEIDQIFLGAQRVRFAYLARKLNEYLTMGTPVAELENETVRPDLSPYANEESFWNSDWKTLVSNCGF